MGFLSPLLLACAALLAVPLWLHLRRKRRQTPVDFPSLWYLKPAADDGPSVAAAGGPAKQTRLIKGASYSGPGDKIEFRTARKGVRLYTDHAEKLAEVPDQIAGAEMICLPNADWNYSAVDLLRFEAREDLTVYLMHDDRLAG